MILRYIYGVSADNHPPTSILLLLAVVNGCDGKRAAAKGSVSAAEGRSSGAGCLFVQNAPCEQIGLAKQVVLE